MKPAVASEPHIFDASFSKMKPYSALSDPFFGEINLS